MDKVFFEDRVFEKIDFNISPSPVAEYENCRFLYCNFANTELSNSSFMECTFQGCNLSTARIIKTAFKDISFIDCKMLGLHFDTSDSFLFSVSFENCQLNLSSFYKRKMKKTSFRNTNLSEVDFTESDLSQAIFENCDLSMAVFENTILEKADLRTSYHYSIDPAINSLKKAKFSLSGLPGLLDKYELDIQ